MAGNIRRNRNNELLAELEAVQRALASQTTSGLSGPSGPPGPQGDQGLAGEDIFQAGTRLDIDTPGLTLYSPTLTSPTMSNATLNTVVLNTQVTGTAIGAGPTQIPAGDHTHATTGPLTLLKANSGTDTTATATTVDSYALSGLTAKDTLLIYYFASSVTATTAAGMLYHVTDAGSMVATSSLVGGNAENLIIAVRQSQNSDVNYAIALQGLGSVSQGSGGSAATGITAFFAATTAWTAAWTIGIRHGGVTNPGTFRWSWALYKLAGQ